MNKDQIKQAILKTAGNPSSGAIKELVDEMADAILLIDEPEKKSYNPVTETRIVESKETR
jgi:hypothetical protein